MTSSVVTMPVNEIAAGWRRQAQVASAARAAKNKIRIGMRRFMEGRKDR